MIALVGASAITLAALQATINAPTQAFRGCLKEATTKAESEKVAGDAIETYLRDKCSVQMESLKSAVIAFRTKNGMSRKAAADDADMTVEDYVATPSDNYRFMIDFNKPPAAPAAVPVQKATPAPAPAAAPTGQPPKR